MAVGSISKTRGQKLEHEIIIETSVGLNLRHFMKSLRLKSNKTLYSIMLKKCLHAYTVHNEVCGIFW